MYTLRRASGYKFDFQTMRYDSDSAECAERIRMMIAQLSTAD